jgi:5-methylcytosine-specific restriction endonuclease McrA
MPTRTKRAQRRAASYGYAGEHFTEEEWLDLLDAFGHRCLRCGADEDLSVDHVVPLSLGGSNAIENIQVLCVPCNIEKGVEVRDYRPSFAMRSSA